MADVCVYTANMGSYDAPREPVEQDIDVDWHYFTDVAGPGCTPPASRTRWNVHVNTPMQDSPMLAAKWWKMHPPVGYEYAIWIDANMEVVRPSFAREAIDTLHSPRTVGGSVRGVVEWDDGTRYEVAPDPTFAVWKHPRRDDFYDEAIAATSTERQGDKYDDARLLEQADAYLALGMPRHTGLYACGTIVWTPEAWPLARDWWCECVDWTPQDQVSLPFVCWARGEWPAVFKYPQLPSRFNRRTGFFENRWLRIYAHTVNA